MEKIQRAEKFYQTMRNKIWIQGYIISDKIKTYEMYYIPILTCKHSQWAETRRCFVLNGL